MRFAFLAKCSIVLAFTALVTGACSPVSAQAPVAESAAKQNAAIVQMLLEPVDLGDVTFNPLTLKEFFTLLAQHYEGRGKKLLITVDTEAFKEENPDAPDIYDTPVTVPARRSGVDMLKHGLRGIPEGNATFLIRRGVVEVTTHTRATIDILLAQKVFAKFDRQPLREVIAELSATSGVSMIVDPYAGRQGSSLITAEFLGDVSVLSAVAVATDMADLRPVVVDGGLYITSAGRIQQFLKQLWQQQSNVMRSQFAHMYPQQRQMYALQQMENLSNDLLMHALMDADPVIRWAAHVHNANRGARRIINDPFAMQSSGQRVAARQSNSGSDAAE